MKRVIILCTVAWACAVTPAWAALSITAGTTGPLTFDTQPMVADGWSTVNVAGDHFSYQDTGSLDAAVQGMDASTINLPLGTSATVPPSTANIARWNSAGHYIQTRPTGIAFLALLATLQNDAGDVINTLTITYDFGGTTAGEDPGLAGHRVYYSLTGAAGSWTLIPELSGDTIGQHTVSLSIGSWAAGTPLYLLWIDDNGAGGTDGYYTIDNLSFTALTGAGALTNLDPSSPADVSVNEGARASFSVAFGGSMPTYQWYKGNTALPLATNLIYVIPAVIPPDGGNYYCIASNNFGTITSRVAVLTINADTTAPVVQSVAVVDDTHIRITLSESISPTTASDVQNYTMQAVGGSAIGIASANLLASNQVEVTLAGPRQSGTDYQFTVRGLQDLAYTPNTMSPYTETLQAGKIGPLTFDALPTLADGWSTLSVAGDHFAVGSAGDMDAAVQTTAASAINTPLGQSATVPPSTAAIARWNSVAHYLETRPTGISHILLLGTFQNLSGVTVPSINIAYDLGSNGEIAEEIPGYRAYYSLTGEPGSWQVIPEFSTGTAGRLSVDLNLGAWLAGAPLYLLWADDNSAAGTDGSYTIDNFVITPAVSTGPLTNLNASVPANATVEEHNAISLLFQVAGSSPSYQWYKNGVPINNATAAAYNIAAASPLDSGNYYCIAQNNFNSITSRVASVGVNPDETKPAVASVQGVGVGQINVVFTEAVNPATATNLENYQLESLTGTALTISSATLQTNIVSLVLATPRNYGIEYLLTVHSVADLAYNPNTMVSQTELVPAEYNQPIFGINHVWKYNTNNVDLGTAWREEVYDDSAWNSGPGILGFETTAGTLAAFANAGEALRTPFGTGNAYPAVRTYYYRTTFEVTNNPAGLGVTVEGWIDDGAVFWINGQEAGFFWPSNYPNLVTPDPNPPLFNTLVPTDVGNETDIKKIILDGLYLRQGINTLAVEVHQVNDTSSDTVMGLRLNLVIPSPVAVTAQPASTNVLEGQPASFTVGISGSLATYQWYFNNQPIAGANSATYTIASTVQANSGSYKVVITNSVSRATSDVATLVVSPDATPPVVTYVMMNTNGDIARIPEFGVSVVTIQFSERVNPADVTNLIAHPSGTGYASPNFFFVREGDPTNTTLHIWEATLDASGTNLTVIVQGKQESPAVNYQLYIGNIRDLAPTPNRMAATMQYTYLRLFVMYGSGGEVQPGVRGWRYNWTGANLGTAWKEPTYNDKITGWDPPLGQYQGDVIPAPYYTTGEDGNANFPTGWGSAWVYIPFSQTVTTYYYRTTFNLPGDPAGVQLRFEVLADDGCVFWLNGQEVHTVQQNGRYYMTNGTETVLATTFATDHEAGTPSQRDPVYPILLKSANVLAVEVHQSATDITSAQPDSVFALQIVATVPPIGKPLRPSLTAQPANIITNVGATVTFTASADGTMPVTNRWYLNTNTLLQTTVTTSATNRITLIRNNVGVADEGTYTLVVMNAAGAVTSTVATLTLQRPPTFTLAPVSTNVAVGVTVTFTAAASGTSPLNYQWYFNSTNRLFGETNTTLTLLNVQADNSGTYSLRAWNAYGTNNSTAATLVVGGGAPPSQPRLGNLVFAGGGGTFSLRIATEAGHTYTLQHNDDNVADQSRWFPVAGASVSGDGTAKSLTDNTATVPRRFYRVAVQ